LEEVWSTLEESTVRAGWRFSESLSNASDDEREVEDSEFYELEEGTRFESSGPPSDETMIALCRFLWKWRFHFTTCQSRSMTGKGFSRSKPRGLRFLADRAGREEADADTEGRHEEKLAVRDADDD
jgi:hypothetical protein